MSYTRKQQIEEARIEAQRFEMNRSILVAESNSTFFSRCIINYKLTDKDQTVFDSNQFSSQYNVFVRVVADYGLGQYKIFLYDYKQKNEKARHSIGANEAPLISAILELIDAIDEC